MSQNWQDLAAAKRAANAEKVPKAWRLDAKYLNNISQDSGANVTEIPRVCGILTHQELEITEVEDATLLLQLLARRTFTAYEVTLAFCKRAAIAQQLVNCLTEALFDEALETARQLDDHLVKHGKPIGPLHGLPIAIKDSFDIKGVQSTIGFVDFLRHPPADRNSAVTDILLRNGAIPFVKTNIPQSLMTADSDNNIFGRTLNPHKLTLTAGGSSGGNGALVRLRGALIGVSTDIAGSIRIPAVCNGVVGYKPSSNRIPLGGSTSPGRLGSPSPIVPVAGPNCLSVRDAELFTRVVLDSNPWQLDDAVLNVPWRRVTPLTRALRFGLLTESSKRPLHPPALRALQTAVRHLRERGHTVMPMESHVPDLYASAALCTSFFLLDPQQTPYKTIKASGEPLIPSLRSGKFPELVGLRPDLDKLWDLNAARRQTLEIYRKFIVEHQLDAFTMPTYQATAVPHDTYGIAIYTTLANLLDYPAVHLPFSHGEELADRAYLREGIEYVPPYVPAQVEGTPTGIQVVGTSMRDEELLEVAKVIEQVLKEAEKRVEAGKTGIRGGRL